MKKGILKSLKTYALKGMSAFAFAVAVLGGVFGFVSCDRPPVTENPNNNQNNNQVTPTPNPDPTPTPTPNPDPDPTPTPTPTPDTSITYQQFVANYPDLAREYAENMVDELSYADDVLSTSYAFVAGEDRINQVLLANVVKTGETERELKIATIDIAGGVDVQDIVDGTDTTLIVIQSENALTFDAKEEFFKQNSTIRTQIANIITQKLGDDAVELAPYVQEEFEPENQIPATVAELVAQYPEQVNAVLNEHFLDDALKTGRFSSLDKSLVHVAKWYLNGQTEINSLDFAFHYTISNTAETFYVIHLALNDTLSISDMLNNANELTNISTTRSSTYSFGYVPTIQGTHNELMNGIFEHFGMYKECP